MLVADLTNPGDGLRAVVEQITASRFRVTFTDTDAMETVAVKFYRALEPAQDEAERFVIQMSAANSLRRSMERILERVA